ncbi:MAG: DUF111 family protein [Lachnospiraceae bacterium]|nr:DUF111 family protein [Lachnospiraceae bacterium]
MGKRVLYLECKSGAAGDMLMGALYGLLTEEQRRVFLEKLNSIWEGVTVTAEEKTQKGIGGIQMHVSVHGQQEDEHMHDHGHEHSHGHDPHEHGYEHEHSHGHDHQEHDHDQNHGHSHDNDPHEHGHGHAHGHGYEHSHGHDHQEHVHSHNHAHSHHHTSYPEILERISSLPVSEQVRRNAAEIYRRIGEAESKVHRTSMEQIHFHEVGSLDALVDVTGSCLAVEMLGVDEILASPVCVGNGTVRCAHGILPVPAPATAEIIKGMPVYFSETDGELLTPTGAAVLKHFVKGYTRELALAIEEIGYGMGTKEFENPSFVRAFLGTME